MQIKYKIFLASLALLFGIVGTVHAATIPTTTSAVNSVELEYSVTSLGSGSYDYQFKLSLDNADNMWSSGHGWGLITVGSGLGSNTVNLTGFTGDSSDLPVGPFTGFQAVSGQTGPVLGMANEFWIPTAVGDALYWSGTSTADVANGELHWFTQTNTGGAQLQVGYASRVSSINPIPEPGTMVLAGLGLVCFMARLRRDHI